MCEYHFRNVDSFVVLFDWNGDAVVCYRDAVVFDVNSDGTVNAADLVTYSNYLLGKENISARQATAADLTADGTANAYDMVLLRRKVVAAAKK